MEAVNHSEFHNTQFPVGSIAYHPSYNYCSIVKSEGAKRLITYQDIYADTLIFKTQEVAVHELQGAIS